MKLYRLAAAVALPFALSGISLAQTTHQDDLKATHHEVKQDEKADKAQAKADKTERKALKSHKVKKAAKQQDKADRAADNAGNPPR